MNTISRTLFALPLLTLVACSHSHQFNQDPEIERLTSSPLLGKQLHLDLDDVPDVYDGKASGHSFHVTGIRSCVRELLTKAYGPENIAASLPADVTIDVELSFDMSGTMLGTAATCKATCTILDADGKTLSTGESLQEASFPVIANGGRNCEIAMTIALPAALDLAVARM